MSATGRNGDGDDGIRTAYRNSAVWEYSDGGTPGSPAWRQLFVVAEFGDLLALGREFSVQGGYLRHVLLDHGILHHDDA